MARTICSRADAGFDAEFLPQLTPQAVLIGLPSFHLAAGKLPLQRKGAITPTLAYQELATLLDEASHYCNRGCGTRHIYSPCGAVWPVLATVIVSKTLLNTTNPQCPWVDWQYAVAKLDDCYVLPAPHP